MIRVHAHAPNIGLQVGAGGNPEIFAQDGNLVVVIEIGSEHWKEFISACQRLRGVGITPAGLAAVPYVPGGGGGNGG